MRKMLFLVLILLAVALVGCGGGDDNTTLPAAQPLLQDAAAQIQNATTFGLILDVDGYPVEISVGDLGTFSDLKLTVTYADGAFQAPDKLDANVEIALGSLSTQIRLIAIDLNHYLRSDIITGGRWLNAEFIPGFSPASLQTEDGGIAQALNSVSSLEMVGKTDLDGLDVYHLRGQVEAAKINSLTFGLIRTQSGLLDIEVYILPDAKRIEHLIIHEPAPAEAGPDAEETTWNITFKDYNASITITAPDN